MVKHLQTIRRQTVDELCECLTILWGWRSKGCCFFKYLDLILFCSLSASCLACLFLSCWGESLVSIELLVLRETVFSYLFTSFFISFFILTLLIARLPLSFLESSLSGAPILLLLFPFLFLIVSARCFCCCIVPLWNLLRPSPRFKKVCRLGFNGVDASRTCYKQDIWRVIKNRNIIPTKTFPVLQ